MAQNIYLAGAEPRSGKSVIALGFMEMLSSLSNKIGFFRPVIVSLQEADSMIELIATRYELACAYESMYGCTYEQAREFLAEDRYDELLKVILNKFKRLQQQCDHILCLGSDYSGVVSALEFDFNADAANNLGCLVVPVVRGFNRDVEQITNATAAFLRLLEERDCDILAAVVNRIDPEHMDAVSEDLNRSLNLKSPLYVVPENASLSKPTIWDIVQALDAKCLYGDPESLNREVHDYKVAAMLLPDFLSYVDSNSLIITPGDRSDIILGSLMSHPSQTYPQISGLLLTGDLAPAKQVTQLIDGLGKVPVAVLSVATDTYTTAMDVNLVSATLSADNERKIAAALGVFEKNVDTEQLQQRMVTTRSTRVTPLMFEYELIRKARRERQHIVLPEGTEPRILLASEILIMRDVADITLLGDPEEVRNKISEMGLHLEQVNIIDPLHSERRQQFAETYYQLRKHKGISKQMAFDTMADVSYFATMMVYHNLADGMVSGSAHTTQHTIRPSFETIRTKADVKIVSSVFFMCLESRVLVFGDCAVNPNPNAEQLADIAINSAATAQKFGVEPCVAMLSYSTGKSGKGEAVDKVREATRLAKQRRPDLKIEGPIQYDAAVDASVAKTKLPGSDVAGHATVFIFPDLNTGNNTYKAVQRSANALAIGPVLQGLNKPVNDLSRGCTVADIVNTVSITAIQAQAD